MGEDITASNAMKYIIIGAVLLAIAVIFTIIKFSGGFRTGIMRYLSFAIIGFCWWTGGLIFAYSLNVKIKSNKQ